MANTSGANGSRVIESYEDRLARYERMKALKDAGQTLESIGAAERPPLTKERVRRILATPPKPVGRPKGASKYGGDAEPT